MTLTSDEKMQGGFVRGPNNELVLAMGGGAGEHIEGGFRRDSDGRLIVIGDITSSGSGSLTADNSWQGKQTYGAGTRLSKSPTQNPASRIFEILEGTDLAPVTDPRPELKISRTIQFPRGSLGAGPQPETTFGVYVHTKALVDHEMSAGAIYGFAETYADATPADPDADADASDGDAEAGKFSAIARAGSGAGAFAIVIGARLDVGVLAAARAKGGEWHVDNFGFDEVVAGTVTQYGEGTATKAMTITPTRGGAGTPYDVGAGIVYKRTEADKQFLYGIRFLRTTVLHDDTGSIKLSCIEDWSGAETMIDSQRPSSIAVVRVANTSTTDKIIQARNSSSAVQYDLYGGGKQTWKQGATANSVSLSPVGDASGAGHGGLYCDGFLELVEQATAPDAPASNRADIYLLDDGAGATEVVFGLANGDRFILHA